MDGVADVDSAIRSHPVAATLLGLVEGLVGVLDEFSAVRSVFGVDRHPAADRDVPGKLFLLVRENF